jgi:hypothetical protein
VSPGHTPAATRLPTRHVVYCERHVGPDGKHDEPTFDMSDGEPAPWKDPARPAGPYHYGLAGVNAGTHPCWWQWPA